MKYFSNIKKLLFLTTLMLVFFSMTTNAQVSFKTSAPQAVEQGQQFRLSYILNKEGKDLRLPEIKGFDVLFGPTVSSSFSQQIINGKTTSQETTYTYTYILTAQKEGSYNIGAASINVDGKTYKSDPVTIKVLPPDKTKQSEDATKNRPQNATSSSTKNPSIKASDAFIRAIVSKSNIYEQEGFTVTFRLYTTLNVVNFGKIEFPEFEGFMVEEMDIPANQQLKMEHYNGRNYYTADLRKTLLFPQRSGKMTIPSGRIEMVFSVPSGKVVSTFFGSQEVMVDVKKPMVTNIISLDVQPLPANKPLNFSGAVGAFTFTPSISTNELRAHEAVTIKIDISGVGNMKLIRNPNIEFPTNFEVYDPTINNSLSSTLQGLKGTRTIEYLAIPRYEGDYTIPPIEFSYFDINTRSYKTVKSPEYSLKVLKGDPAKVSASNYIGQRDVQVESDIRFIKTEEPGFSNKQAFYVGSFKYWMWYIVASLLLLVLILFNKKRARENANISLVRTRKANKIAAKRLKLAGKYLCDQNKERFYDEVLRALWGYFSDKLSIPVAELSKENIAVELSKYGIDEQLIETFTEILDECEFARYAPVATHAGMDNLYKKTLDAIGEMENQLKKRK